MLQSSMFNELVGSFAISKCGHDRGEAYVIVRADKQWVWVANGKNRTIGDPKKKNKRHLYILKDGIALEPLVGAEPVSANLSLSEMLGKFVRGNAESMVREST